MTELISDLHQTTDVRPGWRCLSPTDYLLATSVALFCVLIEQALQVRIGLNLADEGFLWYGVQRVLHGEIPVRDFQAYEPGRYYLLAVWAWLVHSDGIVAMRYGLAFVQMAGLLPALLLALRVLPSKWLLPPFGILLSMSMAPRHKMVDVTATLWMLYVLALLAAKMDRKSHVLAGAAMAALWFIGLNHVLYGIVGVGIVFLATAVSENFPWRLLIRRIKWIFAGMLPVTVAVLIWLFATPHFFVGYWNNAIMRLVESGTTNLTLPVPWPWKVIAPPGLWGKLSAYAVSIGFVLFPTTVVVAFMMLFSPWKIRWMRKYPVALAAAASSLGWAYHAFSRADQPHWVQASSPLLVLLVAIPETINGVWRVVMRTTCWTAVVFLPVFAAASLSPAIAVCAPNAAQYQWREIGGERLYTPDYAWQDYKAASDVVRQFEPRQTALITPYDPGLYAAFRLRCPIYESYVLFPSSASEQREVVEDLQRPGMDWVLYWPDRVDRRTDLGFDQTDPLAWEYILKHFDFIRAVPEARNVRVYRRKTDLTAK